MTVPPAELRAQLVGFRHKHAVPALGAALVTRDGQVDVQFARQTTLKVDVAPVRGEEKTDNNTAQYSVIFSLPS